MHKITIIDFILFRVTTAKKKLGNVLGKGKMGGNRQTERYWRLHVGEGGDRLEGGKRTMKVLNTLPLGRWAISRVAPQHLPPCI